MKLGDIGFIYSGRKDGVHRQGIGLKMDKEAAKSWLGWEDFNNRILFAHFTNKMCRVPIIVTYQPVQPTNGNSSDSDEFYLQLQKQIDSVQRKNVMFLLGDFDTRVDRIEG